MFCSNISEKKKQHNHHHPYTPLTSPFLHSVFILYFTACADVGDSYVLWPTLASFTFKRGTEFMYQVNFKYEERQVVCVCVYESLIHQHFVCHSVQDREEETVLLMPDHQQHSQEDHGYSKWNRDDHQSVEFVNELFHLCRHKQTRTHTGCDHCTEVNITQCIQAPALG